MCLSHKCENYFTIFCFQNIIYQQAIDHNNFGLVQKTKQTGRHITYLMTGYNIKKAIYLPKYCSNRFGI